METLALMHTDYTKQRRIFKPWDNWDMDCVCVPFRGWKRKTKDWSAFEWSMVVGARRTGLSVSITATVLGFSCSTVSHVYQEWPSQLDTTVGSIGVNMGQNPCGMVSAGLGGIVIPSFSHHGIYSITGLVHKRARKNVKKANWASIIRMLTNSAQVIVNLHGGC
jgi:hypothetical protein